jgi:UDP-glucose 4-epimerase
MVNYFIVGGAGFIGSNLVKRILSVEDCATVTIFDNFSSGQWWHLNEIKNNPDLTIINDDVKNLDSLITCMTGSEVVYHFASNPDISKAVTHPDIDFWQGTFLTNNVLEAMRINGIKKLVYASGSGVYGDVGYQETDEDYAPLLPISTYAASKLAGEALISAYCYMFDMDAATFRFANVIGPNQTHGVGYDFIKKLRKNPHELEILGDGTQSKSYIYVTDIIDAIRLIETKHLKGYSYFNVATLDYISVTEIADIIVNVLGLKQVNYKYTGGDRGWKGDVPIVRLNSDKIRKLGWINQYSSKDAMELSIREMVKVVK